MLDHQGAIDYADLIRRATIEAPVSLLSDPAVVKREIRTRVAAGQSIDVDVPYFDIDGEKVWGATAMVLAEFCAILAADNTRATEGTDK